jgi:hypothetical protein
VEHIGVGYKGLFKANQEQTPLWLQNPNCTWLSWAGRL